MISSATQKVRKTRWPLKAPPQNSCKSSTTHAGIEKKTGRIMQTKKAW